MSDKQGLKLPAEWEVIDDIAVIYPDGWDRKNYVESWNTPITYDEWRDRLWRFDPRPPASRMEESAMTYADQLAEESAQAIRAEHQDTWEDDEL